MIRERSEPDGRGFSPAAGIVIALLGILAMLLLTAPAVSRLGLGIPGTMSLGTALLGAPALLALSLWPRAVRPTLGRSVDRRTARLCLLLAGALWVASIGIVTVQALVRPPSEQELDLFRRLHAALAPAGVLDAVTSILVIAVMPAVCEELVMRGVLLTSLARWLGPTAAIYLTAAVFAVVHDPLRLAFAFVLGVVFGYLRVWTASLWPSVLVHALLNTLTFAVAPLVEDPGAPYTPEPLLGLTALAAGAAAATPLLRRLRAQAPRAA